MADFKNAPNAIILVKEPLQIRSISQLVCKPDGQLGMLQHMVVVYSLQCILAGVDVRTVICEVALEDECARISVAIGRSMIRARVPTLSQDVADVAVLP